MDLAKPIAFFLVLNIAVMWVGPMLGFVGPSWGNPPALVVVSAIFGMAAIEAVMFRIAWWMIRDMAA